MPVSHYEVYLGIDMSVRGLPCRGGCATLFRASAVDERDPASFARLCQDRVQHEQSAHGYLHPVPEVNKTAFVPTKRHK